MLAYGNPDVQQQVANYHEQSEALKVHLLIAQTKIHQYAHVNKSAWSFDFNLTLIGQPNLYQFSIQILWAFRNLGTNRSGHAAYIYTLQFPDTFMIHLVF